MSLQTDSQSAEPMKPVSGAKPPFPISSKSDAWRALSCSARVAGADVSGTFFDSPDSCLFQPGEGSDSALNLERAGQELAALASALPVDAALGAVGPGPAARALARALERDRGAGHASDRGIALIVKRVVGHVVVLDVAPDLLLVPVGQGVQLPEAEPLVPTELGRVGARVASRPGEFPRPSSSPRPGPRASAPPCGRRSIRPGVEAAPARCRRSARTRSRSARRARRGCRRSPGTAARCPRRRSAHRARSGGPCRPSPSSSSGRRRRTAGRGGSARSPRRPPPARSAPRPRRRPRPDRRAHRRSSAGPGLGGRCRCRSRSASGGHVPSHMAHSPSPRSTL